MRRFEIIFFLRLTGSTSNYGVVEQLVTGVKLSSKVTYFLNGDIGEPWNWFIEFLGDLIGGSIPSDIF